MKKFFYFSLILLVIFLSGCGNDSQEVSKQPDPDSFNNNEAKITKVSRAEVGFDSIPVHDFSEKKLNRRIEELIYGDAYTDEDMKKGIVAPCLITERFSDSIIEDIHINTSINDVKKVLGNPSFIINDIIFYKSNEYYLAFEGKEKVELACFHKVPKKEYDKEILQTILNGLCLEGIYLTDLLEINEVLSNFFDDSGFVHGGGHYAESSCGIVINTLQSDIYVYNSFEGNLYSVQPENDFKITFKNIDYIIDGMMSKFIFYDIENEGFQRGGKLSPSGKYIAKYDWVTSMARYFTIRATDFSIPDFKVGAAAVGDFAWINDDYIVYTAALTTLPYVVKVERNADLSEDIRLMEGLILDENDDAYAYDYGSFPYDFTILDVKDNIIRLKDNNAERTGSGDGIWEFPYQIDKQGRFILE